MAASMGHQSKLATSATTPITAINGQPFEFQQESMQRRADILDKAGIRGTRAHSKERTRIGFNACQGTVMMAPSPLDLDIWLPRIFGAGPALAETLPEFYMLIDKGGVTAEAFEYQFCQVGRATFSGVPGGFVEMELFIVAKNEVDDVTYPVLTLGTAAADTPYVYTDLVITLVGSARPCLDFELVIDNFAEARFINSVNATDILLRDRIVTLGVNCPWVTANQDLVDQTLFGSSGTLVMTNGAFSCTFSFAALQSPHRTPVVTGRRDEVLVNLEMTARKSGTTAEVVVTNDSTP